MHESQHDKLGSNFIPTAQDSPVSKRQRRMSTSIAPTPKPTSHSGSSTGSSPHHSSAHRVLSLTSPVKANLRNILSQQAASRSEHIRCLSNYSMIFFQNLMLTTLFFCSEPGSCSCSCQYHPETHILTTSCR